MRIREIKQTSPERLTLIFDDGTELKTTLGVVTDRFLCSGTELDGEEYASLCSASTLSLAKARALRIIGARPVSAKMLRDKLVEKGETPENADECVSWLEDMGLIDDRSYAGSVVRHYAAKGYGASRVKQELRRHGIAPELFDEALAEMPQQDETLLRYIRTHLTDPDDRGQVKKVSDALFRRGYGWDEIKHALNSFKAETEDNF